MKDYGVKLAVEIIQKLTSGCSIAGFHFCTLNLEKSVQRVLETLEWTGSSHPVSSAPNKLIVVSNTIKLDVIYSSNLDDHRKHQEHQHIHLLGRILNSSSQLSMPRAQQRKVSRRSQLPRERQVGVNSTMQQPGTISQMDGLGTSRVRHLETKIYGVGRECR